MDANVFSLLLLSGLFGISSPSREFFYVRERMTWLDAQKYCRGTYTDLATIESFDEMYRARATVGSLGDVWIGLTKGAGIHWGWALGDNTLSQYSVWGKNQPDNGHQNGQCGAMYRDGYWYALNCISQYQFVCYDESGGWFHLPYQSGTWREAQLYCRERYTDLTSIHNPSELSRVSSFDPNTDYVWLGLSGDTWYWSDQSTSLFRYWGDGQPLNLNLNYSNCAVMDMSPSGMWSNVACDNNLPFICYRVATPQTKAIVQVTVSSDCKTDLNDPSVKENFLKQIDQKLRSRGAGNYTSLGWREKNGVVFSADVKKKSCVTNGTSSALGIK